MDIVDFVSYGVKLRLSVLGEFFSSMPGDTGPASLRRSRPVH